MMISRSKVVVHKCLLKARIVKPAERAVARERLHKQPTARKWFSSCHVKATTDMHQQQKSLGSGIFCAIRAEAMYNEDQPDPNRVRVESQSFIRERVLQKPVA
jgi:hypothetical protein